jgi:hydrogenase maturation protease
MSEILVLGIGNRLLRDEGAGLHVLDYLERMHTGLPDVRYLDGGTLSFTLAPEIENATGLIVLDAAELKAIPGTVRTLEDQAFDAFLGQPRRSVHEVGLLDLMDIARLTGFLPRYRALVGIQPESFGWDSLPSSAVARAVPAASAEVLHLIARWQEDMARLPVLEAAA